MKYFEIFVNIFLELGLVTYINNINSLDVTFSLFNMNLKYSFAP